MSRFGKEHFNIGNDWRKSCCNFLERNSVKVINPNDYFNFVENPPTYKSQKEVMEFDLNKVRNADLIIVNFNDPASLGTMAELAIAYEKRIPIIGLNEDKYTLHPWQTEMCLRIFDNIDEMLDYIADYYLASVL